MKQKFTHGCGLGNTAGIGGQTTALKSPSQVVHFCLPSPTFWKFHSKLAITWGRGAQSLSLLGKHLKSKSNIVQLLRSGKMHFFFFGHLFDNDDQSPTQLPGSCLEVGCVMLCGQRPPTTSEAKNLELSSCLQEVYISWGRGWGWVPQ